MNKRTMKKYFMKGTDDVLEFGDMIELDLTKDLPNGKVNHHHFDCKFIPELVDMLLESDIIEEVESEEGEDALDFAEECPLMQDILEANEELENKVENLESTVAKLEKTVASLKKTIKSLVA